MIDLYRVRLMSFSVSSVNGQASHIAGQRVKVARVPSLVTPAAEITLVVSHFFCPMETRVIATRTILT